MNTWYTVNKHAPIRTYRVKNNIQPDWLDPIILDKMKEWDKLKKNGNIDKYSDSVVSFVIKRVFVSFLFRFRCVSFLSVSQNVFN